LISAAQSDFHSSLHFVSLGLALGAGKLRLVARTLHCCTLV
jgi:hypothetical protein